MKPLDEAREFLESMGIGRNFDDEVKRLAKLLTEHRREVAEAIAKEIEAATQVHDGDASSSDCAAIARRHGGESR